MAFASDHNESTDFPAKAKELVHDYVCENLLESGETLFDVYVVLFAYILGGWKAHVATTRPDGLYFEVTHSAGRNETYITVYKKQDEIKIVH